MKNIFKFLFFAVLLTCTMLSCSKEEAIDYYLGGQAISLTSDNTSGVISISKLTKDNPAITFNWTNPNYTFQTGVSSQDVSYAIEARIHGTSYIAIVASNTKDLSNAITQKVLSTCLTTDVPSGGLNCTPDSAVTIDIRVRSFLGALSFTNATNIYSSWLTFKVDKPYSQDPDCWILGDATPNGWNNPPSAAQKMIYNRSTKTFSISIALTAGNQVKFVGVSGQWGPMWAATTANFTPISGTPFTLALRPTPNDPDLNSIIAPSPTGTYNIVMDQTHLTCTFTHQ